MRLVEVGGRQVELHIRRSKRVRGHRIVVRYGFPPELVVRPRATEAEIEHAIVTNEAEHVSVLLGALGRPQVPTAFVTGSA